jgi:hypothetical protein
VVRKAYTHLHTGSGAGGLSSLVEFQSLAELDDDEKLAGRVWREEGPSTC